MQPPRQGYVTNLGCVHAVYQINVAISDGSDQRCTASIASIASIAGSDSQDIVAGIDMDNFAGHAGAQIAAQE
jgi:hypothetical protein